MDYLLRLIRKLEESHAHDSVTLVLKGGMRYFTKWEIDLLILRWWYTRYLDLNVEMLLDKGEDNTTVQQCVWWLDVIFFHLSKSETGKNHKNIYTPLLWCWESLTDGDPAIPQHRDNVYSCMIEKTQTKESIPRTIILIPWHVV